MSEHEKAYEGPLDVLAPPDRHFLNLITVSPNPKP
jgi:hypothetical protein